MTRRKEMRIIAAMALFAAVSFAQTASDSATQAARESPVYEDGTVRIAIPAGWSRASGNYPSLQPFRVDGAVVSGNSVLQADSKLLIQKQGYTLALAYRTQHASGAEGGRFIEAFQIPWLTPEDAWTCSQVVGYANPTNGALQLRDMVFDTGVKEVREKCGIPKSLGEWSSGSAGKKLIGERRWYAAYFTRHGEYFFDESGGECESKVYSLTTAAKVPSELPSAEDPQLGQIKLEATAIVQSIHYKRCAPKP